MKTEDLLIATAIATVFLAGSANSQLRSADDVPVTEGVTYEDLNLTLPKDQAKLKRRIGYAASRVCAEVFSVTPSPLFANSKCFRAAIKNADSQMKAAITRAIARARLASTTVSSR